MNTNTLTVFGSGIDTVSKQLKTGSKQALMNRKQFKELRASQGVSYTNNELKRAHDRYLAETGAAGCSAASALLASGKVILHSMTRRDNGRIGMELIEKPDTAPASELSLSELAAAFAERAKAAGTTIADALAALANSKPIEAPATA